MFDKNVRVKEQLLRQSLVSYLGAASDFTGMSNSLCALVTHLSLEPEINLILSPLTMMARHEERASHFLGLFNPCLLSDTYSCRQRLFQVLEMLYQF